MEKRKLTVELLGTSFVIQSGDDPKHLARVAEYLRAKVEEVKARYSFADPLTVALLAALNLADELFKERAGRSPIQGAEPENDEISGVAQRLIDTIDEELLRHTPYGEDDGDPPPSA
jgi:cell division protein ZapA (FtsZ GTPase activity inhibitor)